MSRRQPRWPTLTGFSMLHRLKKSKLKRLLIPVLHVSPHPWSTGSQTVAGVCPDCLWFLAPVLT
jgi:hypothetical protein